MGCSALLLGFNQYWEGTPVAEGFHLWVAPGGLGRLWRSRIRSIRRIRRIRRRRELAAPRSGSGPRPRRARSAVLPRSSPMLIFGVGCPCPGISRHASRRPVRRPEPGREEGRFGQRRRRRRLPGPSMSPRRTLPRPVSLCLCLCLAAAATRGAAQSGECGLPPRHAAPLPPRPCQVEVGPRPQTPSERRRPRVQPRAGTPPSRGEEGRGAAAPRAGEEGRLEGGQGWLRPRRRGASGRLADTLFRPRSEPEPAGGCRRARAPGQGGRAGAGPRGGRARGPRRGPCSPLLRAGRSGRGGRSDNGPGAGEGASRAGAAPPGGRGVRAAPGGSAGPAGGRAGAVEGRTDRRGHRGSRGPGWGLIGQNRTKRLVGQVLLLF